MRSIVSCMPMLESIGLSYKACNPALSSFERAFRWNECAKISHCCLGEVNSINQRIGETTKGDTN